ncbi:MAG: Eco47II family restriction endonuclease, partial [Alphaproteobacteria bacterium]|nr:Eco47II family restriction endonuclease [Alphaproteobacteria bacterium]
MNWNIDFISQNDFENHVAHTISYYGEKLTSYDISKFNANLIDPIKLIFDKSVYSKSWQELINSEIFRQRDKSNTNEIGYFHQRLFRYIKNCRVPDNGKDGGWDIICDFPNGYEISDTEIVHTIFIEMKNKH